MAKTITIAGKTYVLDRGRYKDSKNVGSVSSSKSPQELYRKRVLAEQSRPPIKRAAKAVGAANRRMEQAAGAMAATRKQVGRLAAEKVKRGVQSAGWAEVVRAADMPRRLAADNKARTVQATKIARKLTKESGVLTEKDIQRAKALLPKVTDSKAMRDKKFSMLKGAMAGAAVGKVSKGSVKGAAAGAAMGRRAK